MPGFTKLSSSLTASSIWNEPDTVRIVWITLLAMSDCDGNVKASIVGLAHQARKTLNETKNAMEILLAPDPHSGRKELDGRRVTVIEGGWHLVTHPFYRELGMSEETKRYWRDRKREQRAKSVSDSPRRSKTVKDCPGTAVSGIGDGLKKGESEGEGRPRTLEDVLAFVRSVGLPETDGHYFWEKWQAGGYVNGGKPIKDWKALIRSHKFAGYCPSQKKGFGPSSFQKTTDVNQKRRDDEYERAMRERSNRK